MKEQGKDFNPPFSEGWVSIKPESFGKPLWLEELRLSYSKLFPNSKEKGIIQAVMDTPAIRIGDRYRVKEVAVFDKALGAISELPSFVVLKNHENLSDMSDVDYHRPMPSSAYDREILFQCYLPKSKQEYWIHIDSCYQRERWDEVRREMENLKLLYVPGSSYFLGFERLKEVASDDLSTKAYYNKETVVSAYYSFTDWSDGIWKKPDVLVSLLEEYRGTKYASIIQDAILAIDDLEIESSQKIHSAYEKLHREEHLITKGLLMRLVPILKDKGVELPKVIKYDPGYLYSDEKYYPLIYRFYPSERKLTWQSRGHDSETMIGDDGEEWTKAGRRIIRSLLRLFPSKEELSYIVGKDDLSLLLRDDFDSPMPFYPSF